MIYRASPCKALLTFIVLSYILYVGRASASSNGDGGAEQAAERFFSSHTNNWAVLVATSRFWFNYRHMANTLSIYRTVKRLGIPDSHIILMLADDVACNPRNPKVGAVFSNANQKINTYGDSIEVDYRGYEVTVENFIRILTGRHEPDVPRNKRLLSDERSNILVYMTGHGGDEFLKFQDAEEISSQDLSDSFAQMYQQRRYNEILFMIDTCQANTLYNTFYAPNVIAIGSAEKDENSYSHHIDPDIGVAVIDRFTYYLLDKMEHVERNSTTTLLDIFSVFTFARISSTVRWRAFAFARRLDSVLATDFFGGVQRLEARDFDVASAPLNDESMAYADAEVYVEREERVSVRESVLSKRAPIRTHTLRIDSRPWQNAEFVVGSLSLLLIIFTVSRVMG